MMCTRCFSIIINFTMERKKNWTISKSNQDPSNQQRTDSEQRKMTNKNKGSYKKTHNLYELCRQINVRENERENHE